MYIRSKKSSRNANIAVQLIESYREDGRVKQRMIRHIGTAKNDEELNQLRTLANTIKTQLEHEQLLQQAPDAQGEYAHRLGELEAIGKDKCVRLGALEESARYVLGFHDVYGYVYDALDFTNPFTRPDGRKKAAALLREIVFARIAQPDSKRASVALLETHFGVSLNLDNVYQMMDKIDDAFCERIQQRALAGALALTGEKLQVLFYDATTLYFESFTQDELKVNGYSKDLKFNQPQVLLALFVTEKGLAVGYEVFPGNTFEGHTLIPVLEKLKERYAIKNVIFVADRGMLSKENIEYLEKNDVQYIVGARLKSLTKAQQAKVIAWSQGIEDKTSENEKTHSLDVTPTRRLVLAYKGNRATKDKMDREKSIEKLQAKLKRSQDPKQLLSNYGYQKFLKVDGDATIAVDETKLEEASQWDGLVGIYSNIHTLKENELLKQYRGLWQVEESFRITKHNLRIRPIYHWTPGRVKAHIAIAFMAFACVRYLEYRVQQYSHKLSPEHIRNILWQVQASIVQDKDAEQHYLLPGKLSAQAKELYKIAGAKTPQSVMAIKV